MKKRRRAFIVEKVSGNEWRDSIVSLNEEDILLLRCGKLSEPFLHTPKFGVVTKFLLLVGLGACASEIRSHGRLSSPASYTPPLNLNSRWRETDEPPSIDQHFMGRFGVRVEKRRDGAKKDRRRQKCYFAP
eukprot:scaffold26670_cov149-Skeletonema_menzelii.AAC.13